MPTDQSTDLLDEFLEALIYANNNYGVSYFAKSHTGGGIAKGSCSTTVALKAMAERIGPGWHFYISPNATSNVGKPNLYDVVRVSWLVFDFDPINDSPVRDHNQVLNVVEYALGTPYAIVDTGRGYHFWYRTHSMAAPIWLHLAHKGLVQGLVEEVEHDLAKLGYRLDTSCADVSHVFRLPGTTNPKNGAVARVVALYPTINEVWTTEALSDFYPTTTTVGPSQGLSGSHARGLYDVLTLVPPSTRRFLREGASTTKESRHTRAFAAGAALGEIGCAKPLAAAMVEAAAEKCSPPLTDWQRAFENGYAAGTKLWKPAND